MAAGKSSRINRQYKTKYRIRNWREYERGLRSRGDVTIWLSEDAIAAWIPPKNGLRGGQRRYSNLAIRTALTLRVVFGLPLRQTEEFLDSLLSLMSRDLKTPDHTTLSRRNQIVVVPPLTRAHDRPIDLIVDSTGLKILGCGEWSAHKHKASKKRRDWRKLHIGVDAKGFIVAAELTASSRDDASTLPALLAPLEVPIRRFTADGAYDHRSVYDRASAAGTENVVIVIPSHRSTLSAGPTDGHAGTNHSGDGRWDSGCLPVLSATSAAPGRRLHQRISEQHSQDWEERSVPVRFWQEIQALLRRRDDTLAR